MLLPIGDENVKNNRKPIITYLLLLVNVAVFIYEISLNEVAQEQLILTYGSIPNEITRGIDYYTLITCMFLHGGWMHLIGNMLFLWIFADNIEVTIGNFKFLIFYLLGGIAASLLHSYLDANGATPCVGASGAISACLGAYVILFPKYKIKVFAFLFVFRVYALIFVGLWIGQQLIAGIGSFQLPTADTKEGNVAYWAHIGGFVFGLLAGFYYKKVLPKKNNHTNHN
jgi:membrane associated rhomboid family serine protease